MLATLMHSDPVFVSVVFHGRRDDINGLPAFQRFDLLVGGKFHCTRHCLEG